MQPPTKHAGFQLPGKSDALLVHPHVGQKASWSKGGGANTHALRDVHIIELSVLDASSFLKSFIVWTVGDCLEKVLNFAECRTSNCLPSVSASLNIFPSRSFDPFHNFSRWELFSLCSTTFTPCFDCISQAPHGEYKTALLSLELSVSLIVSMFRVKREGEWK